MKKILSFLTAVAMLTSMAVSAVAADREKGEPDVFVNDSRILFQDQNPIIVDDITLVPARGVFEAMDCDVTWNGENKTVYIESDTGVREIYLTIGSTTMRVITYKSLMNRETVEYELEVPAQVINDRTLIPLRAVSEAMNCEVEWDSEDFAVRITKGEPIYLEGYTPPSPTPVEELVKMSLSTEAETVKAGETFDVYIDVENIPEDMYLSAVVATFEYDKTKLEYVEGSGAFINNDGEPYGENGNIENTEYETGTKVVFINIIEELGLSKDGHAYKATFKKLADGPAEISLGNAFNSIIRYESYYQFSTYENDEQGIVDTVIDGDDLNLDRTPLVIE